MCKQISIIFIFIAFFLAISGCGIKGPLYQTPPEKVDTNSTETEKLNSNTSKR
jgi:predicted small lipoprotein YifL